MRGESSVLVLLSIGGIFLVSLYHVEVVQEIDEKRCHLEHQLNVVGGRSSLVPRYRIVVDAAVTHVVQEDRVPGQHMHRPDAQQHALQQRGRDYFLIISTVWGGEMQQCHYSQATSLTESTRRLFC